MTKEIKLEKERMNLRFEKWDGIYARCAGTIRTIPENYYVCDVDENNQLHFGGLEATTKNCNQKDVLEWWKEKEK